MLKQLIPIQVKDAIKVLLGTARAIPIDRFAEAPKYRSVQDADRYCPVCNQPTNFRPLPYELVLGHQTHQCLYPLWDQETLNLAEYYCEVCGASDRERIYALFFDREWRTGGTVLEIAPQPALTRRLQQLPGTTVRTADLYNLHAQDLVDITDMAIYSDGQFDAFVCSHVLEHVPDDLRAMRELYRVLRPGKWGIVMVPISLSAQSTHEDPSITDPALRWKYFGQADHVRLYAKADWISRLQSVGFQVDQIKAETFGADQCHRMGIASASVLYVARKPPTVDV